MSHLIIKPFDTVYTPSGQFAETWHGLQTCLDEPIALDGSNAPNVFERIVTVGVRPDIDSPLADVPEEYADEIGVCLEDYKLLMANLTAQGHGFLPLHIPKAGYVIHQHRLLFDSMVSACKEVLGNAFEIATLGTLGAYSQFFVSIAVKGEEAMTIGKDDVYRLFFNLNSSHNSLIASNFLLSFIRMVCMNTVQASITDADRNGTRAVIRHTKNSKNLITPEVFAANLRAWRTTVANHKEALEAAKAVPMDVDGFKAFAAGVFTHENSDKLSAVSFNRVEELASLFVRGRGNSGESLYDAINAFTEFFTSGSGVGSANVSQAKRVASANFGRGNEWKLEAIRIASDEEELAKTCQRGAMLYEDKMKEG